MLTSLLLALLPATPSAAPPAPAAVPAAQDQEDLEEKIDRLGDLLSEEDKHGEIIAVVDQLTKRFRDHEATLKGISGQLEAGGEDVDERELKRRQKDLKKEQEAIAEAVAYTLVHPRRKRITQKNLQMWQASAYALGQMGELGAEMLWTVFDREKKFDDEPDFRGLLIVQIGYTKAYRFVEQLVDLLDHHEYLFIARAAEALVQFQDAPGEVRHYAVEKLVKLHAEYWEEAINNPRDLEKQEKNRKTRGPMAEALRALTGVEGMDSPSDWVSWWNDNKKNPEIWGD